MCPGESSGFLIRPEIAYERYNVISTIKNRATIMPVSVVASMSPAAVAVVRMIKHIRENFPAWLLAYEKTNSEMDNIHKNIIPC